MVARSHIQNQSVISKIKHSDKWYASQDFFLWNCKFYKFISLKYTNSQDFNIMYHFPKTKNEGNRRFSVASQDKDIEKLLFTFKLL